MFVVGSNLLILKFLCKVCEIKSKINFNLNKGSDKLRKESNYYLHGVADIFDWKG